MRSCGGDVPCPSCGRTGGSTCLLRVVPGIGSSCVTARLANVLNSQCRDMVEFLKWAIDQDHTTCKAVSIDRRRIREQRDRMIIALLRVFAFFHLFPKLRVGRMLAHNSSVRFPIIHPACPTTSQTWIRRSCVNLASLDTQIWTLSLLHLPNRNPTTHLATSSAPNSLLHFSHPSHITLALSTSNFLALKNLNRCWSVNLSYPGPGLIRSSAGLVGIKFWDSSRARNWVRACCCIASLWGTKG